MPKPDDAPLASRFQRHVISLAGSARTLDPVPLQRLAVGWYNVLAGLYGEPERAYHTLEHVHGMLERFDRIKARVDTLGYQASAGALEIETAIWFHDAIYEAGRSDNEDRSAELAVGFLRSVGAPEAFAVRIHEMIELTTHRVVPFADQPASILLDLDLAALADTWDDFRRNNTNIRKESAALTDETFRWRQVGFLSSLMGRPAIFHTIPDLEQPARRNIERYLLELLHDRF